uniref:G-protein coupled receptors family 1 profile domain-containing protein n=1 Tax=Ascaris lumbricoides TaxID=6252 RepID=A0A9J2PR06_ASCLU
LFYFRVLLFLLAGIFLLAILDFLLLLLVKCLAPEDELLMKVLRIIHDIITPSYTFAFTLLVELICSNIGRNVCALIFSVVERFIATRWAQVYEKHGSHYPKLLALACIASVSTILSVFNVIFFSVFPTCPTIQGRSQFCFLVILAILTVADASCFFMSLHLLHQNKQMFQKQFVAGTQSLTERYQITENIKLTRFGSGDIYYTFSMDDCIAASTLSAEVTINVAHQTTPNI